MKNAKTLQMVQMAILTALILVLSLTPLGYLKVGPVEITLITIPVAVGAILLGPACGAILGGIFGLTSLCQAAFGLSAFGATLWQIDPLKMSVLCVVPRIFCGLLPALLYRSIRGAKGLSVARYPISALACALTNTVLFVGGLWLFFRDAEYIRNIGNTLWLFVVAIVGINGLIEALVTAIAVGGVAKAVDAFMNSKHR